MSRKSKPTISTKEKTTEPAPPFAPSTATGMTPAQFSAVICVSLVMTHCLDAYKSAKAGAEKSTYCSRHFIYPTEDDINESDEPLYKCSESDIGILTLKYQTMMLRIALYLIASLICWANDSLLKSFNYANALSIITSIVCVLFQKKHGNLRGLEIYSLVALAFLSIISNRDGRSNILPLKVTDGMYNIVLFISSSGMSTFMAFHLIHGGPETFLNFEKEEISNGGNALWLTMILVEYSSIMFVSTFALLFFDPTRKRILLFCMGILMLVHAFYQLPMQKDFWQAASMRQNYAMGIFCVIMIGALVPSFEKFEMKR